MIESGIPFNLQEGTTRQYSLLNNYLELLVNTDSGAESATRKTVDASAMDQAFESTRGGETGSKRVVHEHKVTKEDMK